MTRFSTPRERVNFHCDPPVLEALKRLATIRGTTYSELIRLACRQYVLTAAAEIKRDASQIKSVIE